MPQAFQKTSYKPHFQKTTAFAAVVDEYPGLISEDSESVAESGPAEVQADEQLRKCYLTCQSPGISLEIDHRQKIPRGC